MAVAHHLTTLLSAIQLANLSNMKQTSRVVQSVRAIWILTSLLAWSTRSRSHYRSCFTIFMSRVPAEYRQIIHPWTITCVTLLHRDSASNMAVNKVITKRKEIYWACRHISMHSRLKFSWQDRIWVTPVTADYNNVDKNAMFLHSDCSFLGCDTVSLGGYRIPRGTWRLRLHVTTDGRSVSH
jgi:hypothetical protein